MADVDNCVRATYQRRATRSGSDVDISPGIKDAMDRIFPKSPSKFLQNPFTDSHDMRHGGNQLPSSRSSISVSTKSDVNKSLACTVSNAHITTHTTTTATAVFTGLSFAASGTKSPIMSSVPAYCHDRASLPAPAVVKNNVSMHNGDNTLTQPRTVPKARISKADLQMCIQTLEESPTPALSDKIDNDSCVSSQPEASPFTMKKRKKKKNHHRDETDNDAISMITSVGNGYNDAQSSLANGDINSTDCVAEYRSSFVGHQKLPKVLRNHINIDKHAKYIEKKFLPCYVVLKKASDYSVENLDMTLPDRVKHLSDMCAKNHIDCAKFKSIDYRNIFEECLIQNSEDEFVNPRGRSLRKRNQHVSYVEPSEDDLLDECKSFSKRKRLQNKTDVESEQNQQKDEDHVAKLKTEKTDVSEERKTSEKSDKKKNSTRLPQNEEKRQTDVRDVGPSKTGTAQTGMVDDKGRSLVYVFPKGPTMPQSASDKKSTSPKKKIGPASKTRKPLNLPTSSLTTLSLPRSLLGGGVTSRNMAGITSPPAVPPILSPPFSAPGTNTSSPPRFYMVKIDGKDFLVPVMGGSTPPRPGFPGLPNNNPLLTRVSTPNMAAQPFAVPRLSPVMIPGMPMTSAGVRMFSSVLSSSNISTVPMIGAPQLATSGIPVNSLSQLGIGVTRPPHLIPSSVLANAVSGPQNSTAPTTLVSAPTATPVNLTASASLSNLLSKSSVTGTSSLVPPFAAPASTTVLRNTRPRVVVAPSTPIVTPNASATGNRCFRIIVPGCSATGVPARIATLGSHANSSPLTHLAVSSSLLPQRKREKEMSPEKRAAKRRRLEQKYPLPPGVVIKTEPDEVPKTTTPAMQAGSMRSLLGQNIQLITSAARSSGIVQNIRLVAPTSGSRQMRLSSNFIIRTPRNSTINFSPESPSTSVASASSLIVNSTTQGGSAVTENSSTTRTEDCASESTSTTAPSSTVTSTSTTTRSVTTCAPTTPNHSHSILSTSTSPTSDKITTLSYSAPTSNPTTSPSSSSKEQATPSLSSLKESIETLQKLITAQENLGLKGQRLEKLKELLAQKEKVLTDLEKEQTDLQEAQLSGVSASDPVVID